MKEQTCREQLSDLQAQLETAKVEVEKPFPREEELKTKTARLEELNALLNMDEHDKEDAEISAAAAQLISQVGQENDEEMEL